MTKLLPAIFILSALLGAAPAMADEGAGGPVPGLGPGGAGVTDDTPLAATPTLPSVAHGDAIAVYYHHPLHGRHITRETDK